MLQKLIIQNYILIKSLEVEPDTAMNVITGETGAGKSILLGAIGLLMGQRADSKSLYNESEKCVVEGIFRLKDGQLKDLFKENDLDYENPCIIRREISPAGKSRAFVNDTPVVLDQLETIVGELMDIHSQHETILLKKQHYQTQLLDSFAQNGEAKETYRECYLAYKKAEKKYQELLSSSKASAQEQDYVSFIYKELNDAALQPEEQEVLEEEQKLLENTGEIKEKLAQASSMLEGEEFSLLSGMQSLSLLFDQLSSFSEEYKAIKEKLTSIRLELRDISRQVVSLSDKTETNPDRLMLVQDRLNTIYKLERKHHVSSITALLEIQEAFSAKLSAIENYDMALAEAEDELRTAEKQMLEAGQILTSTRASAIPVFQSKTAEKLVLLGMPNATFQIQLTATPPSLEGVEKATFLFSANKGLSPKPIAEVASGGEFSRLMLVIKFLLAAKKEMPTLIFDEIDTGVSGEVAHNMAELISEMSQRHQVFTITHLPQMASKGQAHFFVYKDDTDVRTVSHIRKLDKQERIMEIAKMVGGKTPSQSAIQSATEMLK